ncbi:MAG: RNA methyltransferase, partial [bacterium]
IRDIAGRQNHSVKLARKLQRKKHRRERGLLVGEGMDLLCAAVDAGAEVRDVLVRRELAAGLPPILLQRAARSEHGGMPSVDVGVCDEETLDYASSMGGSVDVIFVCAVPVWNLSDLDLCEDLTLVLAGVGDPGNVGALVRSCAAFGAGGVVCAPGTADPYGPKAMRGGMGAQFLVPVVTEVSPADLKTRLDRVVGDGGPRPEVLVADPHRGEDVRSLRPDRGVLVIMGAERTGPGDEWGHARRVTVPQSRFDSLNVAMAGTILLYELRRELAGK